MRDSDAHLLYMLYKWCNIIIWKYFFDGKKVFTAGSCLQPAVLMSPSPTVPDTNRRWWVHITNGWRTHHRPFMNRRWWNPSITACSGTGGDGPAITIDLNPTVPKTVGDALLELAVIGVAVVVSAFWRRFLTAFHQPMSSRSLTLGESVPQPTLWKKLNHKSLEKEHSTSRWSIVSGAWAQRTQASSSWSPCFFLRAAVQHLSWITNHMKNLHFGGARVLRSNPAPSNGCYPMKKEW